MSEEASCHPPGSKPAGAFGIRITCVLATTKDSCTPPKVYGIRIFPGNSHMHSRMRISYSSLCWIIDLVLVLGCAYCLHSWHSSPGLWASLKASLAWGYGFWYHTKWSPTSDYSVDTLHAHSSMFSSFQVFTWAGMNNRCISFLDNFPHSFLKALWIEAELFWA